MKFADKTSALTDEQRLRFYEFLALNLTVAIRGVWSDTSLCDAEKVERMKTHEWTEKGVVAAVSRSYQAVTGERGRTLTGDGSTT